MFAGQVVHVEMEVAPTTVEFVPAAQLVQAVDPADRENVPAKQLVQMPDPDADQDPGVHGIGGGSASIGMSSQPT